MIGFILAAGLGTRLRPITNHIPKALVPVCGIPLLEIAANKLRRSGCSILGANTHYLAEQIEQYNTAAGLGLGLSHEEGEIRGTGGGLFHARDFLSKDDAFCIYNADIVSDLALKDAFDRFGELECECALVAASAAENGTIFIDKNTRDYLGTTPEQSSTGTAMPADFVGITLYKREFLETLTPHDFSIVPVWSRYRDRGGRVKVMVVPNVKWYDTGTPDELARVHHEVLQGRFATDVPGWILLDKEGHRAYPDSIAKDSLDSLGRNVWSNSSEIATGAAVDNCIIFEGAKVQEGVRVSRQILTEWGNVPYGK